MELMDRDALTPSPLPVGEGRRGEGLALPEFPEMSPCRKPNHGISNPLQT
jgi:hypothetical protein